MPIQHLTHLGIRVADLEAICARIEAAGGGVLKETRLELMEAPGDPNAVPGGPGHRLAS
jgi:hypothetical protein